MMQRPAVEVLAKRLTACLDRLRADLPDGTDGRMDLAAPRRGGFEGAEGEDR